MNYNASITDFFKSPHWRMNLLMAAVAVLIPMVGPIVLSGWIITVLWSRGDEVDPATGPAFDFAYFVKYLQRGAWPFLVQLVTSILIIPFCMVLVIIPILIAQAGASESPTLVGIAVAIGAIVYLAGIFGFYLVTIPLTLRATLTQDFVPAFDFGFAKQFLSLMWKDILGLFLFLVVVSIAMIIVTVITCYIGAFVASPVVIYAWNHLLKQLYQLHLDRGGDAIPRSPKLNDLPPPPPALSA